MKKDKTKPQQLFYKTPQAVLHEVGTGIAIFLLGMMYSLEQTNRNKIYSKGTLYTMTDKTAAKALNVSPDTISKAKLKLIDDGYIEEVFHARDKTRSLSQKGFRLTQKYYELHHKEQELKKYPDEEGIRMLCTAFISRKYTDALIDNMKRSVDSFVIDSSFYNYIEYDELSDNTLLCIYLACEYYLQVANKGKQFSITSQIKYVNETIKNTHYNPFTFIISRFEAVCEHRKGTDDQEGGEWYVAMQYEIALDEYTGNINDDLIDTLQNVILGETSETFFSWVYDALTNYYQAKYQCKDVAAEIEHFLSYDLLALRHYDNLEQHMPVFYEYLSWFDFS